MMYNEIKAGDIPILSFLKGTEYAMYVGPDLPTKMWMAGAVATKGTTNITPLKNAPM